MPGQEGAVGRLRLGCAEGTTPDKWARRWRERHGHPLALVPVATGDEARALAAGEVDACLARVDGPFAGTLPAEHERHLVRLYVERPVAVVGLEHVVSAVDEVTVADLAGEQLVLGPASLPGWSDVATVEPLPFPAMSARDAVEVAASGAGVAVLPMALARLHHRRDVVHRPVVDGPDSPVALVWLRERDGDDVQELVGITKGRTSRSSR